MTEHILNALNWRYGVKKFDTTKPVQDEYIATILEAARLAPSCVGVEPWKFIVVKNPEVRAKIRAVGYDQEKITDSPYLVIIAQRTDAENLAKELVERTAKAQGKTQEELQGLFDMAQGSIGQEWRTPEGLQKWMAAQTYIPLGMMLQSAAMLGVDAGPMEGFDANAIDEILGFKEKNLHTVTMVAFGYRSEDDAFASLPKTRRAYEDVVEIVQ